MVLAAATLVPAMVSSLAAGASLPLPMPALVAVSALQSAALLALAVWAGVALAPRVGLHAPVAEAVAGRRPVTPAVRALLVPGLVLGVVAGAGLAALGAVAPAALVEAGERFAPSMAVRLLYGGVTEELLLRWGLLTALLALLTRVLDGGAPAPGRAAVVMAVLGSALLFGLGHLPAARALTGALTPDVVLYVVAGNAALGALFGVAFVRWGLEAAVLAHAVAHVVGALVGSAVG